MGATPQVEQPADGGTGEENQAIIIHALKENPIYEEREDQRDHGGNEEDAVKRLNYGPWMLSKKQSKGKSRMGPQHLPGGTKSKGKVDHVGPSRNVDGSRYAPLSEDEMEEDVVNQEQNVDDPMALANEAEPVTTVNGRTSKKDTQQKRAGQPSTKFVTNWVGKTPNLAQGSGMQKRLQRAVFTSSRP